VAEVRFAGARAVDPRYLVKSLAGVAVGQPYVEADFRLVLENQIRPMYESVGRLRASFPKVTLAPAAGVRGVVVTVQVEEGEPYILDNVEVRGTPLSEQDLKDAGQFKTGETVSFSAVGLGMARILDLLKAGGHMRASYKAQRQLNDAKKTVNLVVDVEPGPQFRFGKLSLKGLDLETEPVVRKLWAMKPGDPYRGGYPDMFLSQIRERGIFDNLGETKAEAKPDDKTLLVDVLLIFQGEKPQEEKKRPEG
jgi:outer membrane protein assembly factor BamA